MKRVLGIAVLSLCVGCVGVADAATQSKTRTKIASSGGMQVKSGIAIVVNDDVVTFSDIRNRVALYLSGSSSAPTEQARKQVEQQVISKLIDERLQMQEAKALGITVSTDMVREGFAEIAKQNGLSEDVFKSKLEGSGVRLDTLFDQIKAEVAWSQVVRRKIRPQVNISETEIDSEIDKIGKTAKKPQYQVAEIFLPVAAAEDDDRVRHEAEKLTAEIKGGARFSVVAKQFSQSPGAANGGDMGWVQDGQYDAHLMEAIKKMNPGQMSPPIRTEKGYYVVFLRDIRNGAGPSAVEAAQGPLLHINQIMIPLEKNDSNAVKNAKMARAKTLKEDIKSCADMSAKGKDFPSSVTGDKGFLPLAALPKPLQAVASKLADGVVSQPLVASDGILLMMVCERKAPDAATPAATPDKGNDADREKVANKIGMERMNQMQERYLRDLRATAFIDKRL